MEMRNGEACLLQCWQLTTTPEAVLRELGTFLNNAANAHGFQDMGIMLARQKIHELAVAYPDGDPNRAIYMGTGDPNMADSEVYSVSRIADLPDLLADDGPVVTQIGHQWVVHVYTAWDSHFRQDLEAALGLATDDLKLALLGDLRCLRNDIVHHRGIATAEWTGRCEILSHWFIPGQMILIRGQHVAEFMRRFPWDDIRRMETADSE
jgi:hypothetical protein